MKKVSLLPILIVLLTLVGCSSQKKVAYFAGVDSNSATSINKKFRTAHEAHIFPGDMLSITVSGVNPKAVAPFNLALVSYNAPGEEKVNSQLTLLSYLVDINGMINFPVLGTVKLGGLTKSEAISLINEKLSPYLKDAIVTIQFMNYKITVLGEVAKPGEYSINNERVTILDALGLAGDLTIFGKRNNILIKRDNNGKLEFARLNLNTDEIFTSPYYYLQQNDVVYVEPNTVKSIESKNISLYLSSISTLATVVALIISINK